MPRKHKIATNTRLRLCFTTAFLCILIPFMAIKPNLCVHRLRGTSSYMHQQHRQSMKFPFNAFQHLPPSHQVKGERLFVLLPLKAVNVWPTSSTSSISPCSVQHHPSPASGQGPRPTHPKQRVTRTTLTVVQQIWFLFRVATKSVYHLTSYAN